MRRKINGHMFLRTLLILAFSLPGVSCSKLNPFNREPASPLLSNADLAADSALGTIPKKGGAEAGKAVQEIEAEVTAEEMLAELRRKEKKEEEKRLQRIIAEDRILEEQTRNQ